MIYRLWFRSSRGRGSTVCLLLLLLSVSDSDVRLLKRVYWITCGTPFTFIFVFHDVATSFI